MTDECLVGQFHAGDLLSRLREVMDILEIKQGRQQVIGCRVSALFVRVDVPLPHLDGA